MFEGRGLVYFNYQLFTAHFPGFESWQFTCNDPATPDPQKDDGGYIFKANADLRGLDAVAGNVSATTEYGIVNGRLIGARWNILEPHKTYLIDGEQAKRVTLTYGSSTHQMKKDMQALIGNAPCAAVQTFTSRPVAIQGRAYYADM